MNSIARSEQEIEQQPIQNRLPDYEEQHSAEELQEEEEEQPEIPAEIHEVVQDATREDGAPGNTSQ
jgi:hypothetical protein